MRYFKSIMLTIMVMCFIVAHGGSDVNAFIAKPNLGVVTNATVKFFSNDGVTLLGTGNTGPRGFVNVNVGAHRRPVVVVVEGDNVDAQYYDEAAGTRIPFRAGSKMYALVPSPGGTIAVTPLTDIAYRQARVHRVFPLTVCEVRLLNEIVRSSLARGLRSILSVPKRFSANTTLGSLENNAAGRYALLLAALARLGAGNPAPALAVLNSLRIDVADGVIDGRIRRGPLVRRPPLYTNFIVELRAAIRGVAADYGTAGLRALVRGNRFGPVDINVFSLSVKRLCQPPPPPPPPTGGTGGTGGSGSGAGGGGI